MITDETTNAIAESGMALSDSNAALPVLQNAYPFVWVVLPAYNEQESLPPLLRAIQMALEPARVPYSVIVVDDGSKDDTGLIASHASFHMPVVLVTHQKNRGLAAALHTGLSEALGRGGPDDVIVTMDSDNTHPPGLILEMLAMLRDDRDVVIASRFQPGSELHGLPRSRQLYGIGAKWLFKIMFPIRGVADYTCGYRAYHVRCLQEASERYGDRLISETGFSCMADLLLKLRLLNARMGEVPLELHYENRGTDSKMHVLRTIRQTLMLILRRRLGAQ